MNAKEEQVLAERELTRSALREQGDEDDTPTVPIPFEASSDLARRWEAALVASEFLTEIPSMGADAHAMGYTIAAEEILAGTASFVQAKERGLFPNDQDARVEWDRGYEAAICAYRLGYNARLLAEWDVYDVGLETSASIILQLLDRSWPRATRQDPRRRRRRG